MRTPKPRIAMTVNMTEEESRAIRAGSLRHGQRYLGRFLVDCTLDRIRQLDREQQKFQEGEDDISR